MASMSAAAAVAAAAEQQWDPVLTDAIRSVAGEARPATLSGLAIPAAVAMAAISSGSGAGGSKGSKVVFMLHHQSQVSPCQGGNGVGYPWWGMFCFSPVCRVGYVTGHINYVRRHLRRVGILHGDCPGTQLGRVGQCFQVL